MREPPNHVADRDVVETVRRQWDPEIDGVEHLPVGFGAHHWAATTGGERRLFVTYDGLLHRHNADQLENAYASAASLAEHGLEFVLAPCRARTGRFTVPLAEGALSVTRWLDGRSGDGAFQHGDEVQATASMLELLHATAPPPRIPAWTTLVPVSLADELRALLAQPWKTGPYALPARHELLDHLDDIARWASRYHALAERALSNRGTWVATHGEPHTANQIVTGAQRYLVDWESLKLAPPERDLHPLLEEELSRSDWPMGR